MRHVPTSMVSDPAFCIRFLRSIASTDAVTSRPGTSSAGLVGRVRATRRGPDQNDLDAQAGLWGGLSLSQSWEDGDGEASRAGSKMRNCALRLLGEHSFWQ